MGKINKYLIIQPHSDDALFNCSHLLFSMKDEVKILTVENDSKRIGEDIKLYGFLNIPYFHLNVDFKDESYYGYNKEYKEVTVKDTYDYLKKYFGSDKLEEIKEALVKWVNDFMLKNSDYKIIVPWGVGHPFHLFIRDICQKALSYKLLYYREFPHSYKKRSQIQVEEQKKIYTLLELVSVEDFHDIKWKLASKFYRSQSGLQFYEQGYIKKKLPEEIYSL